MRNLHRRSLAAAAATVSIAVAVTGCGGGKSATATSTTTAATSTTPAKKTVSPSKLTPRTPDNSGGPNKTIADYIRQQHITETDVHKDDTGAPRVVLPYPDGWTDAGSDTPDYALGAIEYTGPEAAQGNYTPNIIAILSKLDGNADPQKIIDLAGGEMRNLPGYAQIGDGGVVATVSGFPAYRIAGTYDLSGTSAVSAQETVVIPAANGLYVLQLNATGNQDQMAILQNAIQTVDEQIRITA